MILTGKLRKLNRREKTYHGLCVANSRFVGKVVGMFEKEKGKVKSEQQFERYLSSLLKRSKVIVALLELAEKEQNENFLIEEKVSLCRDFSDFFRLFRNGNFAELKKESDILFFHLSEIEKKVEQKLEIKNEPHHITALDVLRKELAKE